MEVLTPVKESRKPKIKETPNGGVQTNNDFNDRIGFKKPISMNVNEAGETETVIIADPQTDDEAKAPATGMRKHPLNIAPDANAKQFALVENSMKERGFDKRFPIDVCSDGTFTAGIENFHFIADGWTRWQVCQKLGIVPVFRHVKGTDKEILDLCINSNSRKIYTKDQWACICTDYKEANAEILAKEVKEKKSEGGKKGGESKGGHKNDQPKKREKRTNEIIIETLGADTNRNKVDETDKLKEENPEAFKEVKDAKKTLKQVRDEKKASAEEKERIQKERESGNVSAEAEKFADGLANAMLTGKTFEFEMPENPNLKPLAAGADSGNMTIFGVDSGINIRKQAEKDKAEKLVLTHIKKAKEKVIELQNKVKGVMASIVIIQEKKLSKNDNKAEAKKEAKKFDNEISMLVSRKNDYNSDIESIFYNLGYLLVFNQKHLITRNNSYESEITI